MERLTCLLRFMWIQSGITIAFQGLPYIVYFKAWIYYLLDMSFYLVLRKRLRQGGGFGRLERLEPDFIRRTVAWLSSMLGKAWGNFKKALALLFCALFTFYSVMLALSIRFTIDASELDPAANLLDPGQLLPLITGIVATVSAIANFTNHKSLSTLEVRKEKLLDGSALRFYGNGIPPPLADEEGEFIPLRNR